MILPDEFDEKIELWVGETDSEDEGPATPTRTTSSRRVRRTSSRRHTRGTRGISLGPAGEGLIFLKKKLELAAAAQDEEPITRKREDRRCKRSSSRAEICTRARTTDGHMSMSPVGLFSLRGSFLPINRPNNSTGTRYPKPPTPPESTLDRRQSQDRVHDPSLSEIDASAQATQNPSMEHIEEPKPPPTFLGAAWAWVWKWTKPRSQSEGRSDEQ